MRIVKLKEAIINLDLLASVIVETDSSGVAISRIKLNMAGAQHDITDQADIKKLQEIWEKEQAKV